MPAPGELPRLRSACSSVAGLLPAVAAGDASLEGRAEEHVASCLRCQADLARYRRLRRTLRAFGEPAMQPGPDLLPSILASLEAAGLPRAARQTARWVAAGSVLGASIAIGGAVAALRLRQPRR